MIPILLKQNLIFEDIKCFIYYIRFYITYLINILMHIDLGIYYLRIFCGNYTKLILFAILKIVARWCPSKILDGGGGAK